jgi:hypothetical protein
MLVILLIVAGCSMNANPKVGNMSNFSAGTTPPYTLTPGPNDGSSQSGGTQTWQVTFSVVRTSNEKGSNTFYSSKTGAPNVQESSEKSYATDLYGSFPITVNHNNYGDGDVYNAGSDSNPVSGSYTESDHSSTSEGYTRDGREQASYTTSHFEFIIQPKEWGIIISAPSTGTVHTTDSDGSDQTSTRNEPAYFRCFSGEDFFKGTKDFHRNGAAYEITCQGAVPLAGSHTDNYNGLPSSVSITGTTTLHVILDPNYVQGVSTPSFTPPTLVPPQPDESLAPLVPPTVELAPLVTNNP